jgi:hypothetical protein
MSDLLRARGIPFAVLLYPLLLRRGDGLASDEAFAEVRRFLTEAGIRHYDLSGEFRGRDLDPLRLVPGDLHAGPEGHRLFAHGVGHRLVRDNWLRRAPRKNASEDR